MKKLLLASSALLFLSLLDLPIGFYTFLRIVVTIGAIAVVITEYEKDMNFWVISFGLIAILFNPIIPVHLHDKETWAVIDIITGVLFAIKGFNTNNKPE
jgi:hypothetical protein